MPLNLPSPPVAAIVDSESDEGSVVEIWEHADLPQDAVVMKTRDICCDLQRKMGTAGRVANATRERLSAIKAELAQLVKRISEETNKAIRKEMRERDRILREEDATLRKQADLVDKQIQGLEQHLEEGHRRMAQAIADYHVKRSGEVSVTSDRIEVATVAK